MRAFICVLMQVLCTFLWTTKSYSQTEYCNNYGNRQVCNTYHTDGTMEQKTTTDYGSTSSVDYTKSPYGE